MIGLVVSDLDSIDVVLISFIIVSIAHK